MIRALRLLSLALVAFVLVLPRSALAQKGGVEVHASVSSETVEVGETFIVELSALAGDKVRFSDPLLRLPPGLSGQGPSTSSKTMVQMGAAGTMFRRGLSAKWRLQASATGRYTIPAPSLRVDGRTVVSDAALRVTVVAAGQRPARKANPMDPFGMGLPFDDPLGDFFKDAQPKREGELIIDEPVFDVDALGAGARALSLARPDDPYLFLRIVPDKTKVVIGEQVTLHYYEYYRVTNERFDEREPKLQDFLRVPLEDEPGQAQRATTSVGNRIWFVQELDRVAVFPLRSGALHTGSLNAQFRIPYLKNQAARRESNDVVIEVGEPPMDRRPVGYHLGDVGKFDLTATVTPKETVAGETVSVTVRVEGRGVMPNQLKVPERTGVEWLSPEKQDTSDVQAGRVGGTRTFGYAVRVLEEGDVALGWVELPYFDPDKKEYRIARAALGSVTVKPKPGAISPPTPSNAPEGDPFATMPGPRMSQQAFDANRRHALGLGVFFAWLLAPLATVIASRLAARGIAHVRARRLAANATPGHLAHTALRELEGAADGATLAGVAERAVHLGIESATNLKSRGVLIDELPAELERRGLPKDLALRTRDVLAACATLRYNPTATKADGADLGRTTRAVVAELLSHEPGEQP